MSSRYPKLSKTKTQLLNFLPQTCSSSSLPILVDHIVMLPLAQAKHLEVTFDSASPQPSHQLLTLAPSSKHVQHASHHPPLLPSRSGPSPAFSWVTAVTSYRPHVFYFCSWQSMLNTEATVAPLKRKPNHVTDQKPPMLSHFTEE